MAETSTIFGFMKYVSATDILSDFKKTVDSYFVNSLKRKYLLSLNNNHKLYFFGFLSCILIFPKEMAGVLPAYVWTRVLRPAQAFKSSSLHNHHS